MSDAAEGLKKLLEALMGSTPSGTHTKTVEGKSQTAMHLGPSGQINAASSGQDRLMPALNFVDSDGNEIVVFIDTPQQMVSLAAALGVIAAMQTTTLTTLRDLLHDDEALGCRKSHKVIGQAVETAVQAMGSIVQQGAKRDFSPEPAGAPDDSTKH